MKENRWIFFFFLFKKRRSEKKLYAKTQQLFLKKQKKRKKKKEKRSYIGGKTRHELQINNVGQQKHGVVHISNRCVWQFRELQ